MKPIKEPDQLSEIHRHILVVLMLIGLVACTAKSSSPATPATITTTSTTRASPRETSITRLTEPPPTPAPPRPSATPLFAGVPGIIRVPNHFPKESSYALEPRRPTGYSLSPNGRYFTVSYRVKSSEICDPPLDDCLAYILFLVDTAIGEAREPFPEGQTHITQAAPFWSPDSQIFTFSPGDDQVWLVKTASSEAYPLSDGDGGVWSPDGLELVITKTEPGSFERPHHTTVSILDLMGRQEILFEADGLPNLLARSPDGEHIAMTWSKTNSPYEDLYVIKVSDPKPKPIRYALNMLPPMSWTTDSRWIVVREGGTMQFIHWDGQCSLTPLA